MKNRNVTARKFSTLMDKNSGLSLPRTAQSPREDPNRGVGGPGQPLGKGRPGHRVGAGPPHIASAAAQGERRKVPAVRSPAHGIEKERAASSSRPGGLSFSLFPRYNLSTGKCPIVSELFKSGKIIHWRDCPAYICPPISAPAYWP